MEHPSNRRLSSSALAPEPSEDCRMRRITPNAWRAAAGTITVALFAACSPSPVTSPQNSVLTQPQANAVAEVVATDAASLGDGATLDAATGTPFAVAPMPGPPALATSAGTFTPTPSPPPPDHPDGPPAPAPGRPDV